MYRCKKCGAMLNDWRGHAEACPQAGMPESIEATPSQPYYVQPYYVPQYVPFRPYVLPYTTWGPASTGSDTFTGARVVTSGYAVSA